MLYKKMLIRGQDGSVYLVRRAMNTPFFGIKLHHILRSDEDRDLHDHPWSFLSIILLGGYWEHTFATDCTGSTAPEHDFWQSPTFLNEPAHCLSCGLHKDATHRRWYGPLSVLWRPAPSTHRLELPEGKTAWSLVFTGPKRREWGFHTICGWIPWMHYTQKKQEGC